MCGIAGWYRRGGKVVGKATISAQCDSILHRGPDDGGILTDGDFGFGMRRLAILDIEGGHQPMETANLRFAIVFNGEIYNHLEIRKALEAKGVSFRTHSDTETILAAFEAYGNDAWAMLEGMFAVAIWDRRERRLTLARDPLGIKPLYFTCQDGGLAFASELKALTLLSALRFEIDDRAVHDFFRFGHVRKPRSIYKRVGNLDPGHWLAMSADGEVTRGCFWAPRFDVRSGLSDAEWITRMREMLRSVTERHLQSDVEVATLLSGGIDSSAVLAAMARTMDAPLTAFTIAHPGSKIDESDAAARIARHFGCRHIVEPLDMDSSISALPKILACYDEPFADMASIPTWFASRLAAGVVKVILCGEGGDELFAGYKRHRNARVIERLRPLTGGGGRLAAAASAISLLPGARLNLLRQHAKRVAEFAELDDGYQQFFAATEISSRALRRSIYNADFCAAQDGLRSYTDLEDEYFSKGNAPRSSSLDEFLFADLTLNMPSAMLPRLDRASMAHSVEARVPFLSHIMVDWALTVPERMKLRGATGKYLLRKAVAPWLPPNIARRPKQGFQVPMADWLRREFGDFARQCWNDSGASRAGYLVRSQVDRLFREHAGGAADHSRMLYAVTAFSLWWEDSQVDAHVIKAAYAE
jgi:asparagine synthase (glutamine-hydrolysing)